MGWNTVVVVLNDATDVIEHDTRFGERLVSGMRAMSHGKQVDISARSDRINHGNAATIISHDHADGQQIVVVHGNTGYRISHDPGDGTPDSVIKYVEMILKMRKRAAAKTEKA